MRYTIDDDKITLAILMADYRDLCDLRSVLAREVTPIEPALRYLEGYINTLARDIGPLKLKALRNKMLEEVGIVSKRRLSRA